MTMMKDFAQLKKNLKKDTAQLKPVRIALLGDTSTQFLAQALKGMGMEYGVNIELHEADFNQVEQQVYSPDSDLYVFKPEIVILFRSSHKLLHKHNKLSPGSQHTLAASEIGSIEQLYKTITSALKTKIIYYNYAEIDDSVFGNYANKTERSFLFQLRKLNYELMGFAAVNPDFYICDLSSIQNRMGRATLFSPAMYINAEMTLSLDALPQVAAKTLDIVNALNGKFKKCLILDLDNTVWGGIIGDDGVENIQVGSLGIGKAFSEFQQWAKKLKDRGIILAVCSKNTESVAKEPFETHPDMALKLDDIAVFIANWENKVDNIREIQRILNIGFDSMVFIDDNPFERNMVRENIPGIAVPEMPEDPAEFLEYLYSLNLFETVSVSEEDSERTRFYQVEAQRITVQKQFTNEDDFLQSLNMRSLIEPFNKFNTPRVAQLSQRSNQFNLRTVRYTDSDIQTISTSGDYHTFAFTLEDKFGDNGLICVLVLKNNNGNELFIESWFMSCRVLKRGMENFALNTIVSFAKDKGIKTIKGEYIPTAKNGMVVDHYKNLGFEFSDGYWRISTDGYQQRKCFIQAR